MITHPTSFDLNDVYKAIYRRQSQEFPDLKCECGECVAYVHPRKIRCCQWFADAMHERMLCRWRATGDLGSAPPAWGNLTYRGCKLVVQPCRSPWRDAYLGTL